MTIRTKQIQIDYLDIVTLFFYPLSVTINKGLCMLLKNDQCGIVMQVDKIVFPVEGSMGKRCVFTDNTNTVHISPLISYGAKTHHISSCTHTRLARFCFVQGFCRNLRVRFGQYHGICMEGNKAMYPGYRYIQDKQ